MPLSSMLASFFQPLIDVTQNFATLQTSTISAGRVFEMMDRDHLIPSKLVAWKEGWAGDIRFEHVSFFLWWQTGCPKRSPLRSKTDKPSLLLAILVLVNPLLSISSCAFMNLIVARSWLMDRISGLQPGSLAQVHWSSVAGTFLYHGTIASNIECIMKNWQMRKSDKQLHLWM